MKKIGILFLPLFVNALVATSVLAASPGGEVVNLYPVADSQAVDGDILTSVSRGLVRASSAYDGKMFGVLEAKPTVVFQTGESGDQPVARSGLIKVNVTNINGTINKGDYVTSSKTLGKGQKATQSGYVLGIAMESLSGQNGQILVAVRVEYAEISNARTISRVLDALLAGFFANVHDPGQFNQIVRYVSAGIILILAFAFSFITFSRSVSKAVEAIGRNPLARGTIILSLVMTILLVLATVAIGLVAAIVILRI